MEARHLHPGEAEQDPAEEEQLLAREVGEERVARELHRRALALREPCDREPRERRIGRKAPRKVPIVATRVDWSTRRKLRNMAAQKTESITTTR
jgi:hypothetical protein